MRKKGNVIFPICLLVFDLFYVWQTGSIEIKKLGTTGGARLVPYICAIILAVCCINLLVQELRKAKHDSTHAQAVESSSTKDGAQQSNYKNVVITLLFIISYAAVFTTLGFIVSTILFVACQVFVLMPTKNARNLLYALIAGIITAICVYLLFTKLFYVILPSGIL